MDFIYTYPHTHRHCTHTSAPIEALQETHQLPDLSVYRLVTGDSISDLADLTQFDQ